MADLPKIILAQDGPLIVENPPKLKSAAEADLTGKPKAALCRCGASANKPFCNGAHVKIGFESALVGAGITGGLGLAISLMKYAIQ